MIVRVVAFVSLILTMAGPVSAANSAANFYRGRTLYMQIGSSPGGVYDVAGRLVARYIGKYIPGHPNIVVQDVPGGGSLVLANQFGNTTARDGSVFGVFNDGMPTTPLTDPAAAHFDPRLFNFIGSPSGDTQIVVVWHTSPVQTYSDLFKRPLIVGATSPGAAPYDFPFLTNELIGTKFKIVTGYQGGAATKLAMRNGEINGEAGLAWGSYKTDYVSEAKAHEVKIVAAFGMKKDPELPDIPLLPVGNDQATRQLFQIMYARQDYGRIFLMPPGVPADRVAALRQAFIATMKDPGFLVDAAKVHIDVRPVSGQELTDLTLALYRTPASVAQRLQRIMRSAKR